MVWFRRWVIEGYSIRQLESQSGWSASTLRRTIQYFLDTPPPDRTDFALFFHLIADGTYLEKRNGIYAIMDGENHELITGEYGITEGTKTMLLYLQGLKLDGLNPKSVTVDGNPGVILAFKVVWPDIIIQRCLVHIQRQGLMWCRRHPKRTDAKKLRNLFLSLTSISTAEERDAWISKLMAWEKQYGSRITVAKESGWVFSDLKRARSMVLKAMPDMFHHLIDPDIPATTNGLEGYFARLKHHYRQHRGLSQRNRTNYFRWYFHLCKH